MHFKVYLLRHRGHRLASRDWKNSKTYVGTLHTHTMVVKGSEPYQVLDLEPSTGPNATADRPPPLYAPVLLGFAPLAFRLRGFERIDGDGGSSVLQEWHCEEA